MTRAFVVPLPHDVSTVIKMIVVQSIVGEPLKNQCVSYDFYYMQVSGHAFDGLRPQQYYQAASTY